MNEFYRLTGVEQARKVLEFARLGARCKVRFNVRNKTTTFKCPDRATMDGLIEYFELRGLKYTGGLWRPHHGYVLKMHARLV